MLFVISIYTISYNIARRLGLVEAIFLIRVKQVELSMYTLTMVPFRFFENAFNAKRRASNSFSFM